MRPETFLKLADILGRTGDFPKDVELKLEATFIAFRRQGPSYSIGYLGYRIIFLC